MEHYRSTLATTAVAVLGLVAAAHILHPGNYEVQPRPARAPVAVSAGPTAWVDPPADLRVAAAPVIRAHAVPAPVETAGTPSLLAPRMVAAFAPGAIMAPTLPGTMALPARVQKVAALQRRKAVQRARTRQASLDRGSVAAASAEPSATVPAKKSGIDPIGDLIRGLGLGGEG